MLEAAFDRDHATAAVAGDVDLPKFGSFPVGGVAGVADLGIDAGTAWSSRCCIADGGASEGDDGKGKDGFDHG